ncbi:hypothetical protein A6F68_01306 [Tsuneonella dongtanensis]|uniref:17 kDa surface antigen n=1 Tax=Tsuneonella dongtanensis TaxID=692370 RepID=A0A1B2ACE6_9SPHN|nr:hypothetical protein [Tsuneonella dongtanensis]ANY19823.1 hypothetical protein A6F68_01306 [Tsuneonella dongtanensis]
MKTVSTAFAKGTVATVAAGAMALASATPAMARDRNDDGIDAGDIIAGALVIGGIAAVASSIGKDRYRGTYGEPYYGDTRYGDRYGDRYGYDYRRNGNSRQAVEQCVSAAQRDLSRRGYRGVRVTDIRDIDRKRDGYRVKGTLIVNERGSGWGRDYNYRYGGRDYDRANFSCEVRYGRIADLDYSGLKNQSRYSNRYGYGW